MKDNCRSFNEKPLMLALFPSWSGLAEIDLNLCDHVKG